MKRWVALRPCTAYSPRAGLICYPNAVISMLAPTRGPGVGDRAVRIERFTASIRY